MSRRNLRFKICTLCGKRRPLSDFYKNRCYFDGYSTRCKECLRGYSRVYGPSYRIDKFREHPDWPIIHCAFCGKPFRRNPIILKNLKTEKSFCNEECRKAHRREQSQQSKITFYCPNCSRIIYKNPSTVKNKKRRRFFCSPKCKEDWLKKSMFFIPCQNCGRTLRRPLRTILEQRFFFCNRECWHEWRHIVKGKNEYWGCNGRMVKCSICGGEIYRSKRSLREGKNYFCSGKCLGIWQSENRIGENSPSWQGGKSFEPYTVEFNETLKEQIRLRDGYRCQKCGCPEIENKEKLSIHHIDYNKENCLPFNLISLCNRCNAAVNKNRKYWERHFRKKLKKIRNSSVQLFFRSSMKRLSGPRGMKHVAAPFGYRRNPANESEFLPVQEEQEIIRVIKILRRHCFFLPEIAERLNGWSSYFSYGNRTKPVNWRRGHIQNILKQPNGHRKNLRVTFHLKSIPAGLLTEFPSDNGNGYVKERRRKISCH